MLLKAAIAKEHPLLIFSKTPRPEAYPNQRLSFEALVKDGKTLAYSELPDVLWATTGFALPNRNQYLASGRLRNALQHFAVPQVSPTDEVLRYLCNVADPVLREFWGTQIFAEIDARWGEQDRYLFDDEPLIPEALEAAGIEYDGWVPQPSAGTSP